MTTLLSHFLYPYSAIENVKMHHIMLHAEMAALSCEDHSLLLILKLILIPAYLLFCLF